MVYWEYNLGITERNMEIKEYTEFKADEILQLYTQVGWTAYTEDMPALERGYKNSLLVLAAYENGELLGIVRVVGDGTTIVLVQDILVYPARQRQGIGTALLKAVLRQPFRPAAGERSTGRAHRDEEYELHFRHLPCH